MLRSLTIQNYALIDDISVNFSKPFAIITGETGAGKSILLGGLALVLGKRADLGSLKKTDKKCVIEAVFDITNYHLNTFFEAADLDYDHQTIIRREILPNGKSRAFINDSPVNLSDLQDLGALLIDVHSQHQTQQLINDDYQYKIIDALAKNQELLAQYATCFKNYKTIQKALQELLNIKLHSSKEQDYNNFLLKELTDAKLVQGEYESLLEEFNSLSHVEFIKEKLAEANQLLTNDQIGGISILTNVKLALQKITSFSHKYDDLYQRVTASVIELNDIFAEVESLQEAMDSNDPDQLTTLNNKINRYNNLMQKHGVDTVLALIEKRDELHKEVAAVLNIDDSISDKQNELATTEATLEQLAKQIHQNRSHAIPYLKTQLETILAQLGMENAQFKIDLSYQNVFLNHGKDALSMLFTANKGAAYTELKKSASGGELSRIMLAIKSILANHTQLPTLIFDEIDTGVSGEISNKMGEIMRTMSTKLQVITITHLPQVAAKGELHFKVYKQDIDNETQTQVKILNAEERIIEIAQMLSGEEISQSAIAHAKELLN